MEQFVGLDLGTYAIRAVAIQNKGNELHLISVKESQIDDFPDLAAALQDTFNDKSLSKSQIWGGLPISDCVVRTMTVPFTDDNQIKQTIKFSCEEVIHENVDNYLIDYEIIEKSDTDTKLLIIGGQREAITEKLEMYQACHLDLEGMTCSKLGLYNLAARIHGIDSAPQEKQDTLEEAISDDDIGDEDSDTYIMVEESSDSVPNASDNFLLLDIGLSTTDVIVGNSDKLLFFRSISTTFDPHSDQVFDKTRLDRLFKELKRTLFSSSFNGDYGHVYVCGGITMVPSITLEIEKQLNCPTEILPVSRAFASSDVDDRHLALYAQATGLAIMATKKANINVNFRRDEFIKTPILLQIKVPLIILLMVALCFLTWEGYFLDREKRYFHESNVKKNSQQIQTMIKLLCTNEMKIEYNELPNSARIGFLESNSIIPPEYERSNTPEWLTTHIENRISNVGDSSEKPYVLDVLKKFLPHLMSLKDFQLINMDIDHRFIKVKGSAPDEASFDAFNIRVQGKFNDDELFDGVTMSPATLNPKTNRWEFTLNTKLNVEQWAQ